MIFECDMIDILTALIFVERILWEMDVYCFDIVYNCGYSGDVFYIINTFNIIMVQLYCND